MQNDMQDPLTGQLVAGRYRVVQRLGEGGMGQVYLARHEAIEKPIALKVLKPEYSAKEDIVTRFQQEAISASRIKHPNVVDVFDFGKLDNGCAFLAMELLSGNDLADELMKRGYIETRRALRILLQLCRALSAAHKAGVVHRDMKPDNVFLQRSEEGDEIVKIVDFGIAQLRKTDDEARSATPRRRLTKTGMIFGTPEYMAPEQAAGRGADLRVDIYAVGLILFEMLTGTVPFTGDSFMAVLAAHLNDPVPSMLQYRPDLVISQQLHEVVKRSLAKNPNERFQTMGELAASLLATPEGQGLGFASDLTSQSVPPPPATAGPSHVTRAQYESQAGAPQNLSAPASTSHTASLGTPGRAQAAGTAISVVVDMGSDPKASVPGVALADAPVTPRAGSAEVITSHDQAKPSRGATLTLGLVAGVLVLGGGGWFVFNQKEPVAAPLPAADAVSAGVMLSGAAAATTPVPTPSAASSAPVIEVVTGPAVAAVVPAQTIKLSVRTEPAGAVLKKDGFQVCDSTPCEVELNTGDAVQLEAVLGNRRGLTKVLAQKDQSVTITLKGPATAPKAKLCEVSVGGLKILRPCPK
jgi:eukaryotic-like serine/threonine-protein kinase